MLIANPDHKTSHEGLLEACKANAFTNVAPAFDGQVIRLEAEG